MLDRVRSCYRRVPAQQRTAHKSFAMLTGSSYGAALTNQVADLRNSLPEPIDYPQHASNVAIGAIVGGVAANAVVAFCERLRPRERTHGRVRAIAAASAAIGGLLVNAAFETRMGIKLLHVESFAGTPDSLDFAYGVASSAATGAVAPAFEHEQPQVSLPAAPQEDFSHFDRPA